VGDKNRSGKGLTEQLKRGKNGLKGVGKHREKTGEKTSWPTRKREGNEKKRLMGALWRKRPARKNGKKPLKGGAPYEST